MWYKLTSWELKNSENSIMRSAYVADTKDGHRNEQTNERIDFPITTMPLYYHL